MTINVIKSPDIIQCVYDFLQDDKYRLISRSWNKVQNTRFDMHRKLPPLRFVKNIRCLKADKLGSMEVEKLARVCSHSLQVMQCRYMCFETAFCICRDFHALEELYVRIDDPASKKVTILPNETELRFSNIRKMICPYIFSLNSGIMAILPFCDRLTDIVVHNDFDSLMLLNYPLPDSLQSIDIRFSSMIALNRTDGFREAGVRLGKLPNLKTCLVDIVCFRSTQFFADFLQEFFEGISCSKSLLNLAVLTNQRSHHICSRSLDKLTSMDHSLQSLEISQPVCECTDLHDFFRTHFLLQSSTRPLRIGM